MSKYRTPPQGRVDSFPKDDSLPIQLILEYAHLDEMWHYLQSEMEFVAVEMCDRFAAHPAYQKVGTEEWLAENPLPVPTEREIGTQKKGEPVYRALFERLKSTD